MKICVTGKGGSGKSVVSALLAMQLAQKGYSVLVVDADESNLGLARMLGVEEKPSLMQELGGKAGLRDKMRSTAPILSESYRRISDIPSSNLAGAGGVSLVKIGKIEHSGEGCACPMGVLSRDFLSRLVPADREVVVTDMEAGIEHFGRGVDASADAIVVVVNANYEAVLLAEKIVQMGKDLGTRVVVTLNNVTPETQGPLTDSLREKSISVAASIRSDPAVFEACLKGQPLRGVAALENVAGLAEALGL